MHAIKNKNAQWVTYIPGALHAGSVPGVVAVVLLALVIATICVQCDENIRNIVVSFLNSSFN